MSRRRRVIDGPPFTAIGLAWPWVAPWRIRAAAGIPEPPPPPEAPTFTLLSLNALGNNEQPEALAEAVADVEADVILVVEASDVILDALVWAEIEHHHGAGLVERRPRYHGCGVWSSHRLTLVESGDLCDEEVAYIAARVHLPVGDVDVIAVHTYAPATRGSGRLWRQSFDRLAGIVERCGRPVVAAGDYNATMGHRPYPDFLARSGLRDAHLAAGRGTARTWPAPGHFRGVGPFALIDRVAISPDLAVVSIEERRFPGSDHLGVLSTLAIVDAGAGGPDASDDGAPRSSSS